MQQSMHSDLILVNRNDRPPGPLLMWLLAKSDCGILGGYLSRSLNYVFPVLTALLNFKVLNRKILDNMQSEAPVLNNAPPAMIQHPGAIAHASQHHQPNVQMFYVPQVYLHNPSDLYPPLPPSNQPTPIDTLITNILKHRSKEVPPVRKGPITTLPADIILHIFKMGISDDDCQEKIDFAVLVSHVCRAWRNVALSCSSLWANIIITPGNMHDTNGHPATANRSLLCAQEFALRSRVLPLSVRLKLPMTVSGTGVYLGTRVMVIMDWLRLLFPRVKFLSNLETCEIDFGAKAQCFFNRLLPPYHLPFVFLTHRIAEKAEDNIRPKLKQVKLSGLPICWPMWSLTRLTSLSINYMAIDECPSMDMLRLVLELNKETLERFEIQGAINASDDAREKMPTELPRLTHLTIGFVKEWDAISFFFTFHTPALKHLKLRHIARSIIDDHWRRLHGYSAVTTVIPNHALQLPENISSTVLFEDLLYTHTSLLQQIESLELQEIYVIPLFDDKFKHDNDPLKQSYHCRVVFAYRVLAACSQLRCLILAEPDQCFLDALNIYPDDTDKSRPVAPPLTHLYIFCADHDRLKLFLQKRAEILEEDGSRRLEHLGLGTNEGRLAEVMRLENIDLGCLAKKSVIS
ncbi:uncharacterized protein EDB91DRAFT_1154571 [Suillus paluster]|uniref:uncharacterized protein n=1 Tax=Suillus paluster TaxID=48578 RepID=UPI001B86096C|nr:uncharacterized protein EDB91DRAFT_1154571 [Suillus paluster]KAG1731333.1 hypothetical protein EDB91DRAFT_1154571 [Suillus paluster]